MPRRVTAPVDSRLNTTEVCRRTRQREGSALLITRPTGSDVLELGNLFVTADGFATAEERAKMQRGPK